MTAYGFNGSTATRVIIVVCALVLATFIIIMNVVRPGGDAGLMKASCGELHAQARLVPYALVIDPSAMDKAPALAAYSSSVAWGRALGVTTTGDDEDWARFDAALNRGGPEPEGEILVVSGQGHDALLGKLEDGSYIGDYGEKVNKTRIRLRWNPKTCEIGYGVLWYDDGEELDYEMLRAVTLHEVGHMIGLDHDPDTRSIMNIDVTKRAPGEPFFRREVTTLDLDIVKAIR